MTGQAWPRYMEPQLNFLEVPGVRAKFSSQRRIAWWEWNATGSEQSDQVVLCVHGLSRQARDFDVLAQALASQVRVLCVDIAGRGQSDWLAEPMDYQLPTYVADMAELLRHLRLGFEQATGRDGAELRLDWVGTSMGGLIGMALAAIASFGLASVMDMPYVFQPGINLLAFVFSAAIGVVFGYVPARRAARLDPIDALRHE